MNHNAPEQPEPTTAASVEAPAALPKTIEGLWTWDSRIERHKVIQMYDQGSTDNRPNPRSFPRAGFAGLFLLIVGLGFSPAAVRTSSLPQDRPLPSEHVLLIGPVRRPQVCRFGSPPSSPSCHAVGNAADRAVGGALGDLDGDGRLEAVLIMTNDLWICPAEEEPTRPCIAATKGRDESFAGVGDLALGDIDRDGRLDLVLIERDIRGDKARWCRNDGSFGFRCQDIGPGDMPGGHLALGDVDADGDLDIAIAVYQEDAPSAHLCLNSGDGAFDCRAIAPPKAAIADLGFVRLDDDEQLDLWFELQAGSGHHICQARADTGFDCRPLEIEPTGPPGWRPALAALRNGPASAPDLVLTGWPTRLCRETGARSDPTLRVGCTINAFDGLGSHTALALDLDGDEVDEVVLGGPNRLCRRIETDTFACTALGDADAHARIIVAAVDAPAPPPSPSPSPVSPTTTPPPTPIVRPTIAPSETPTATQPPSPAPPSPTAWPTRMRPGPSPTAVALASAPDGQHGIRLRERGTLDLPPYIESLDQAGALVVAYGGTCSVTDPPTVCDAAAVLIDVTDPDQPLTIGTYRPNPPDTVILDTLLHGSTLYLITERRLGEREQPGRRLSTVDISDPAKPFQVSGLRIAPSAEGVYEEAIPSGMVRLGNRLILGTSTALRIYDITRPLRPVLVGRVALPATGIGAIGTDLYVAGPPQDLRLLDASDPSRIVDLGLAGISAGGRSISGLTAIHVTEGRVFAELRLACSDPAQPMPPFSSPTWPCGSGLAEVIRDPAPPHGPRQSWYGLLSNEHGLGTVQALDDMLLVTQEQLVILDTAGELPSLLARVPLTREVEGQTRKALPFDLRVHDGRALVLTRVDERQPARLRVMELSRRRVYLPFGIR